MACLEMPESSPDRVSQLDAFALGDAVGWGCNFELLMLSSGMDRSFRSEAAKARHGIAGMERSEIPGNRPQQ